MVTRTLSGQRLMRSVPELEYRDRALLSHLKSNELIQTRGSVY